MPLVYSFPPIENAQSRILILGSMPGVASLRAGEYYAHPRNHFWKVMESLLPETVGAAYDERVLVLSRAGIALWDVLKSCKREGSLDSNIDKAMQIPNDFQSFFLQHQQITRIFFNGSAAEQIFNKRVLPDLTRLTATRLRLPSTSPAHAAMSFERKLAAWREILSIDDSA